MIDTHAHLEFPDFADDLDAVLCRAAAAGVRAMISVGGEPPRNERACELASAYRQVFAALGIHPHWSNSSTHAHEDWIAAHLDREKVVAVGEVGLDYHYDFSPRSIQRAVFVRMVELARDAAKPLMIHSREAFADTFEVLKDVAPVRGVVHCFSYSLAEAQAFLGLGLHLSFCGQITFPACTDLRDVAREVPLERLLLETDCPFLTPVPLRGKRNEPAHVRYIAIKHAELRGIILDELVAATTRNARGLFGLSLEDSP